MWRVVAGLTSRAGVALAAAGAPAPEAFARFLEPDADEIDREERLNSETSIDALSYRFPLPYQDLWEARDIGFRVSAGSLTVSRFAYEEDLKLSTPVEALTGAAFRSSRQEDFVEQRQEREFRLWAQVGGRWRLSLLGDGGTYKEYGDLGGAAAFWTDRSRWVELHYWSVDHFYNEKRSDPEDSRPQATRTVGTEGAWRFGSWQARWSLDVDTPLTWERASRGYVYEYERRVGRYRAAFDLGAPRRILLGGYAEEKHEAKRWQRNGEELGRKALTRRVQEHEAALTWVRGGAVETLGILYLERSADYSFAAPSIEKEEWALEPSSPEAVRRRELSLYATKWGPVKSSAQALQYGLFLDPVVIREDRAVWRRLEVKGQVAWDYAFNPGAHLLLNTTWDLDKIVRYYPYETKERGFKPWGGGNIQIIAVF